MKQAQSAIGTMVTSVSKWNPRDSQGQFTYIDISSVDRDLKAINGSQELDCSDAPSRARQLLQTGDVLVATVRPNLNGVALVDEEHDGATASTGFCVLRPKPAKLNSGFLFHWVKTPQFISDMVGKATGQNYPAVSDKAVKASLMPSIRLDEQERIAEILDKADGIRRKRAEAILLADDFLKSAFLDMFKNPEEQGWKVTTVANMAIQQKDSIRTGPFGSQLLHSEFVDKGIAVLGIDNAVANEFRWAGRRFITEEKYETLKRYTVFPGDVLITIMGTCGRCAIVPDDVPRAINTKHLCCITPDRKICLPSYLKSYFLHHPMARRYLNRVTKGAIMDGLNMGFVKEMPIPRAPINLQKDFARLVEKAQSARLQLQKSEGESDDLFNSLVQRAFRGKL